MYNAYMQASIHTHHTHTHAHTHTHTHTHTSCVFCACILIQHRQPRVFGHGTQNVHTHLSYDLSYQVYETLLAPTNTHNPSDKASYPHVRTLLEFDTREFLNVLAMVSSDAYCSPCMFTTELTDLKVKIEVGLWNCS